MRLICGLISLNGEDSDAARLQAMCSSLQQPHARAHVRTWQQGPAALAVLDFDPSASAYGNAVFQTGAGNILAADLRLDDVPDLRQRLNAPALPAENLAAEALDRWGDAAPGRLLGDFALAHWNPHSRQLLLARDIAAVRPLVYHHAPGRHFLFASFPYAIHASGLLPRELDETAFIRSMYQGYGKVDTWSRGVVALAPGSTLRLHDDRVERKTYWRPTLQPRRHSTPADAAQELRALLTAAVESRVAGTAPVAAHLSGGLDSSGLTILASRALARQGRQLFGYSFLLPPEKRIPEDDESPYVEAVLAQEPGIRWQPVHPRTDGGLDVDPDRGLPLDENDTENAVCRFAASSGAQMVLSGWGGDEGATFNGRGMLAHAFGHLRWLYLWRELQAQRRERGLGMRHLLLGQTVSPLLPPWALSAAYRLLRQGGISAKPDVLNPGPLSQEQHVGDPLRVGSSLRRTQLALLSSAHLSVRTGNWAHIGSRYGLAFAFPMLDRRVQEFALSLPPTWHVRDGWRRRPYRDAMKGVLPELVRWRHDKLAPLPQVADAIFAHRGIMLAHLDDLGKHPRVQAIFNVDAVRSLVLQIPERTDAGTKPGARAAFAHACAAQAMRHMAYLAQHF